MKNDIDFLLNDINPENLYAAFKDSKVGVWRLAMRDAGMYISLDKTGRDMFGYTEHRVYEMHDFIKLAIHPDDRERIIKDVFEYASGTSANSSGEYRGRHFTLNAWHWMSITACSYNRGMSDGNFELYGILQDIDDRMDSQKRIEEEQKRLDTVIYAAALGVWDWNIKTGYVHYNARWAEIIGYSLDELAPNVSSWENALLPEDLSKANAIVDAHCAGKTSFYEAEFRMRHKDGHIIWGIDRGRIVEYDVDGSPLRLMGILQDITTKKLAEEELAASKEQLELTMHAARFGTWDWNVHAGTLKYNAVYRDLLGYKENELTNTYEEWESFVHPDDLAKSSEAMEEHFSGKKPVYDCELRMRLKSGDYIWTRDIGRVTERDSDGNPSRVVGGHINIEDAKLFEQERERSLDTIARQKNILEEQIKERTMVLDIIQQRLRAILGTSGAGLSMRMLLDMPASSKLDNKLVLPGNFVYDINSAFNFITDKMWWYKAVIDSIPYPIFVTDNLKRYTYLNKPAVASMSGKKLEEIIGTTYQEWGVDDHGLSSSGLACLERGEKEFTLLHSELKRFFKGHASYLSDTEGNKIGHIETIYDVTEVHEADERLRIMLDSNPMCCNFWDENFNNIDCNAAAAALFDLKDKQEYLDKFYELSPKYQPGGMLSSELAHQHITQAFAEGYSRFEWMHQKLDGTPMPSEITLVRVEKDGSYIVVGYTRDLRELKDKEAELDKERVLLKKILDNSPVCFLIIIEDTIEFVTPFAQEFLGVGVNDNILDVFTDSIEREEMFAELARTGSVNWRVVSILSADSTVKEMLTNAFAAEYYGEPCIMAWFLDITEMRDKERELRLARDAAEESAKAKSDFLANMSHEIRTPMNAVLGMTKLVLNTDLTIRQRDYLEKSEHSAKALLRILNDILDFSKIEAGKMEMEEAPFDLEEVARRATDINLPRAVEKDLELLLDIQPDTPVKLYGDPLRLHQVLINLLSNALKFTQRGEVSLRISLQGIDQDKATIYFSVDDTGIGLNDEQTEKLFSPFTQADTSTTRRYGGTGLGLAICKNLVDIMGGSIGCRKNEAGGATFYFTGVFKLSSSTRSADMVKDELKGMRVLAIDDNIKALKGLEEVLRSFACVVSSAADFAGAENILRMPEASFDFIILDWGLPRNESIKLCQLAKDLFLQSSKTPNIIAIDTDYWSEEALARTTSYGVKNVLLKPVTQNSLYLAMLAILGNVAAKPAAPLVVYESDTARHLRNARILLAEDNEINQMVANEMLEQASIQVTIANNGKEVLDLLAAKEFDLILMDIQMPEMDGIEATRLIRADQRYAGLPIVAMTAHAMVGDKEKSLQAGMNDHITKPIEQEEMLATLAKWIPANSGGSQIIDMVSQNQTQNISYDFGKLNNNLNGLLKELRTRRFILAQKAFNNVKNIVMPSNITVKLNEIEKLIFACNFIEAERHTENIISDLE